jgi:two-component system OmpR family response regulator
MRVLVVEDDDALSQVMTRGLREEGYGVDVELTCGGAEEAMRLNEYDVVVLDLALPDGDGLDVCRSARSRGLLTPILMLTARGALDERVAGLDAGADDYLAKPFDFSELAARIRALLRRPARALSPILEAGDMRLDPASHRVWRGPVLIPLTAKEFALLHELMARIGEVVTRSELLEHVWDAHYDGLSNVVDVHVASLRRKLDAPSGPAPIDTVRGVGYRVRS